MVIPVQEPLMGYPPWLALDKAPGWRLYALFFIKVGQILDADGALVLDMASLPFLRRCSKYRWNRPAYPWTWGWHRTSRSGQSRGPEHRIPAHLPLAMRYSWNEKSKRNKNIGITRTFCSESSTCSISLVERNMTKLIWEISEKSGINTGKVNRIFEKNLTTFVKMLIFVLVACGGELTELMDNTKYLLVLRD